MLSGHYQSPQVARTNGAVIDVQTDQYGNLYTVPGPMAPSAPQAIIFDTDGTYNYYAFAAPGTLASAASWKVMRVLIADGVTTTWANGNANYTNVGTASGLPGLSYS